jgi:hypothetical protein
MLIVHIPCREWLNDTEIWKYGEERKKARCGAIKKDELGISAWVKGCWLTVEGRLPFDRFNYR